MFLGFENALVQRFRELKPVFVMIFMESIYQNANFNQNFVISKKTAVDITY